MAITFISSGAIATAFSSAVTPVPGSYTTGDALLYSSGEFFGSDVVATPSGWTLLSNDSVVKQLKIFGRIAQSNSETIPGVTWGTSTGWAHISVFRGVASAFTSTMTGTGERAGNTITGIINTATARTPTQDGSLAFWVGGMNKTSTTDGKTYSPPTNWTVGAQIAPNGNKLTATVGYWIQSTATIVPANSIMTASINETVNQSMFSTMVFLAPAVTGGGGTGTPLFPPLKRKIYVFYDNYYPR